MKRNDSDKVYILEGENGIRLTHLAVEGTYLFTLRIDGVIVQWDYQKGEVVQEIQTAFAKGKGQPLFNSLKAEMATVKKTRGIQEPICDYSGSFWVKNGLIALKYRRPLRFPTVCEIINYVNPNESQILSDVAFGELMIKQNKLFSFCDVRFTVFDLLTNEKQSFAYKIDPMQRIQDIDVVKNVLCGTMTDRTILLFDHITGNELKSFKIEDSPKIFTMIGNLLIGFGYKEIPMVVDLNTERRIYIPDLFCFNNNIINIGEFTRLINICKANLGIATSSTQFHCKIWGLPFSI